MPEAFSSLTTNEQKAIQATRKWSKTAFYVSLASLIIAIAVIIVAILY